MDQNIEKIVDVLDELYKSLDSVRDDTIKNLGEEKALHISNYHADNCIDLIVTWIPSQYKDKESNNMVFMQFTRMFKELYWLQFLFLAGNYPLIYRNLRYLLEMMAQAYYVDLKYHRLNIDEKFEKIKDLEREFYGWNLIEHILTKICETNISESNRESLIDNSHNIWKYYLNKHVHPSSIQMERDLFDEEDLYSSLVTDTFIKKCADDALTTIDYVLDLIYAIIFSSYPRIGDSLLHDKFINKWKFHSPVTMKLVCECKEHT